jgi:hypothetical protein
LSPGGIVAVDTYAGASAWRIGALERRRVEADGVEIRWLWEQRHADPCTAEVVNALSFRVLVRGDVVVDLHDAFVCRWRLWSIPELVEALREAGLRGVCVETRIDEPCAAPERERARSDDRDANCVALVYGRAESSAARSPARACRRGSR